MDFVRQNGVSVHHSRLGTDPKKIKYGFSEHGPISFDPPTSEGFSEQNYSEIW